MNSKEIPIDHFGRAVFSKPTFCRMLFHLMLLSVSRRQGLCPVKMGNTGSNEAKQVPLITGLLSTFNMEICNVNF